MSCRYGTVYVGDRSPREAPIVGLVPARYETRVAEGSNPSSYTILGTYVYEYKIEITNVVDGDTLDASIDLGFNVIIKERIRLLGVNTPEVYGTNASIEGKVASAFTKEWFAERDSFGYFLLVSEKYDAREKYGRCLGRVYYVPHTGVRQCLNDVLILKGWAY